jgi:hypothetical protein
MYLKLRDHPHASSQRLSATGHLADNQVSGGPSSATLQRGGAAAETPLAKLLKSGVNGINRASIVTSTTRFGASGGSNRPTRLPSFRGSATILNQFGKRLCDGDDHFIRFTRIDFVGTASRGGILGKKIFDQVDHHARVQVDTGAPHFSKLLSIGSTRMISRCMRPFLVHVSPI